MPKITYQNKDFYLRWPKESDWIILDIGHRYGSWKLFNYKTGQTRRLYVVDWKKAEKCGELKGLPTCTLLQLAKRYGDLKRRYGDPNYVKRKSKKNKQYQTKRKNNSFVNRLPIWQSIPDEIKIKYGHKPKQIWTEQQKKLLLKIAKEYTHTNVDWKKVIEDSLVEKLPVHTIAKLAHYYQHLQNTNHPTHTWTKQQINILMKLSKKYTKDEIDWSSLMDDDRLKQLPEKYNNDLHHLRKYYWNVVRKDRNSPEYIKKRREDALRWKNENKDQYRRNQQRRTKMIKRVVADYLLKQLGTRKK